MSVCQGPRCNHPLPAGCRLYCGDVCRRLARILAHLTGLTTKEILDIAYHDAEDMLAN